jgi:hypothetical protein
MSIIAGSRLRAAALNLDAFIIEVDTTKAGTPSNQFEFTNALGDYDVVAKQNNIVVATFNDLSNQETITLPSSGVYVLEVMPRGAFGFNRIIFSNGGDKLKITDIKQWGTIAWSSFDSAFFGCENMLVTATDSPDLSICTNIADMFKIAIIANPNVSNWNLSNINMMNGVFVLATLANPNVTNWDVSSATLMGFIFFGAPNANPNARDWDVSNATDLNNIFTDSNMSVENLTACYENWSQLNLQQNVPFSAGTTKYNASGQAGRDILVNTYNWNITDGGQV